MRKKENIKKDIKEKLIKIQKSKENIKIDFGILSKKEIDLVKAKTGINLDGYRRILDSSSIKHVIKNHGNKEVEEKRGQIAVVEDDFLKIPEIADTNNVIFEGVNKRGLRVLLYMKKIKGVYYFYQEIRTKRKELAMLTMYKKKG